ncbi:MAG: polymorphic toxin-type HINT domain-containing protein [Sulfuritalea sp.]|nr:polymorphic toxin-type HINT domain-containing protein [Sulfuritalea sp.]MDP1984527.1 polymorphic toxin-type HINT domain-containing protein [Sulfuritalea sp.]
MGNSDARRCGAALAVLPAAGSVGAADFSSSVAPLIVHPETLGGCFVAGTLVHTDQGLVPIEQLKVGDLVLSQPEQQGERAYRKITRTFVHEDQPIWVVKCMLIDGDVPWGHPKYMAKDETMHHCYATGNHPFWVEGQGWIAVEELKDYQVLVLANGQRGHVQLVWPVLRGIQPGFGRVCSNTYAEGQEVHIVDFRHGSNLWKYPRHRHHEAPVPYQDGIPYEELGKIPHLEDGNDALFKTRVYNIEVEDFHTYYIGELGVWVHNKQPSLQLVHPNTGGKMPDSTRIFESENELEGEIART